MDKTELTIELPRSSPTGNDHDRIKDFCINNLGLHENELARLFKREGTLLISSEKSDDEIERIIRDLSTLGALVARARPTPPHQETDRSNATHRTPRKRRRIAIPELEPSPVPRVLYSQQSSTRRWRRAVGLGLLITASVVGVALLWIASRPPARTPWPRNQTSWDRTSQDTLALLLERSVRGEPRTFEGNARAQGLEFSATITAALPDISLRLLAAADAQPNETSHPRIERAEAEPIFFRKESPTEYVASTTAVVTVRTSDGPARESATIDARLATSDEGTPRQLTVRMRNLKILASESTGQTDSETLASRSHFADDFVIEATIPVSAR